MRINTFASSAGFAIVVVVAVVALWVFPSVMFPAPGANDAPILWSLPMPIAALTLAASLVAVVRDRSRQRPVTRSVALATYVAGVAAAFVVALLIGVANLQNDRFWAFLLTPAVFGITGILFVVVAVIGRRATGSELVSGVVIGGLAAVFLLMWIVARGARDWLLAPYGFDICLLIALESAVVFIVGGFRRVPTMIR